MTNSAEDWCQCEHVCHQTGPINPGHAAYHSYGQSTDTDLQEVKTQYGTFTICAACRQHHPIPEEYLA